KVGESIEDSQKAIATGTTISDVKIINGGGGPTGATVTLSKAAVSDATSTTFTVTDPVYYPGGGTDAPTVLVVFGRKPEPISLNEKYLGCGMTILKAKAVNVLATDFSVAGSNAAGSAVGTIGGFGADLGVFGKISVGDNKAVTSVVQVTVSELIKRLTV